MALNIPFNLASIAAAQSQQQGMAAGAASAAKTATVQPAASGADTRGAASDGEHSKGQGAGQHWLQLAKPRTSMMATPDRAAPTSIVSAQTQDQHNKAALQSGPKYDSAATSSAASDSTTHRPDRVDRYAPPDPLPTAPILKHMTAAPKQV